jgi:LacI family transcriptional regulator
MGLFDGSNTITDIARLADVSTATVSRVINNPKVVKSETREKVQEVIKKINYTPNRLARGLIIKSTNTIGIILQDINNMYYPSVIRGVEDRFSESDYGLFLCNTDGDIEKEKKHINLLIERRVDGLILLGTRPLGIDKNQHVLEVAKSIPLITLNDSIKGEGIYSVQNDEEKGAYDAVSYLIGLGHERIAIINGNKNFTTYEYKLAGYKKALKENHLSIKQEYIVKVEPYERGGHEGVQKLLKTNYPPTAIFVASDQISIGVYKAIYECGYRIPEDVSVIGFGGISLANEMYPELTTVNQFPYKLGRVAAETMIQVLGKGNPKSKHKIIHCKLELGKSCSGISQKKT